MVVLVLMLLKLPFCVSDKFTTRSETRSLPQTGSLILQGSKFMCVWVEGTDSVDWCLSSRFLGISFEINLSLF